MLFAKLSLAAVLRDFLEDMPPWIKHAHRGLIVVILSWGFFTLVTPTIQVYLCAPPRSSIGVEDYWYGSAGLNVTKDCFMAIVPLFTVLGVDEGSARRVIGVLLSLCVL